MEMSLTSAAQNGASSSYERSPVSYVRLPFFLGQAKAAVESINDQKDCETNMAWWVSENSSLIEEFHTLKSLIEEHTHLNFLDLHSTLLTRV